MRRKGRKVIKPAGSELMDYLNKGYAICNKCGAVMDRKEDPEGGCGIYACPSCGWEIEELDYEYESADEMELGLDERGDEYLIFRDDMPPAGCKACGGPTLTAKRHAKCLTIKALSTEEGPVTGAFLFLFWRWRCDTTMKSLQFICRCTESVIFATIRSTIAAHCLKSEIKVLL